MGRDGQENTPSWPGLTFLARVDAHIPAQSSDPFPVMSARNSGTKEGSGNKKDCDCDVGVGDIATFDCSLRGSAVGYGMLGRDDYAHPRFHGD